MKKVSIGSWAYVFGEYEKNPVLLPQLCKKLRELNFDGISMGGFAPHANPKIYNTKEKRTELKKLLADYELEVVEYVADLWSIDSLEDPKAWLALYDESIEFMAQMGFKTIRIDSGTQPILKNAMTYDQAQDIIKKNFIHCAKKAKIEGIDVAWEFEPGFIINEPKNIISTYEDVNEDNFSILFDTCHGYMSSVMGARHIEEGCTLKGGLDEFISMCKGKIGLAHVIDSDGTLNIANTSTHFPFGLGKIDFDKAIPALLDKAEYKRDWWVIDLCEWPDAWKVTEQCKLFVDDFNKKYCK